MFYRAFCNPIAWPAIKLALNVFVVIQNNKTQDAYLKQPVCNHHTYASLISGPSLINRG